MDAVALINESGTGSVSGHAGAVPWWSFGKTVLAVAALRLVEDGRLSLAEPVDGQPFSLRQLLQHEAGLPDYGSLPHYHHDVAAGKAPWSVARLLAEADAGRLRYKPGTAWAYSNLGYLRVTQLIERASGLIPTRVESDTQKASSPFLKKRTKKLLTPLQHRSGKNRDSRTKAFCFFFSKKKGFLALRASMFSRVGISLAEWLAGAVFKPAGVTASRLALCRADLSAVRMGCANGYHPRWVYPAGCTTA